MMVKPRKAPKRQKVWMVSPKQPPAPKVPDAVKAEVQTRADAIIEQEWKPDIPPPPENTQFGYLTNIHAGWYRHFFHFTMTYRYDGPDAIAPTREHKFARFEYLANGHFNIAYYRHTGQWWDIYFDQPLDECFKLLIEDPNLTPLF